MARTTAPLFSLDASGTIAKSLVFSKWRGRQYVRRHAIPKNPQSPAQVGIRTALKFLTQSFKTNIDDITDAFTEIAANANVSILNAYVQYNMRRWRMGHGLTVTYPATDPTVTETITQTLTGGQRNVLVSVTPSAAPNGWGIAIYRNTATITTINWNLCIAIVSLNGANAVLFTDGPLAPGTYHYRSAYLRLTGGIGAGCADASAAAS
jgi:hypothetical protein